MDVSVNKERGRGFALNDGIVGLIVVAVLFALTFLLSEFQLIIASEMLIIGLFSLSLNLILGYGGMVHFGHAAFYGVGGYTAALLPLHMGVHPYIAMLLAPFFAAAVASVIGWFSVRRVGLYFAILTLAFGQLMYIIAFNAREFTNGDDGLIGLEFPALITPKPNYYLFTLIVFVVSYLLIRMIVRSPFILTLRAIRENPERAQFIGVDVRRHQLIVFILGAFFAGIAGALMVGLKHQINPSIMFWTTSSVPILGSLLGGMFSLPGPVIGGALLVFLETLLNRITGGFWSLVLGSLTVILVLVAPSGLVGLYQRLTGQEDEE